MKDAKLDWYFPKAHIQRLCNLKNYLTNCNIEYIINIGNDNRKNAVTTLWVNGTSLGQANVPLFFIRSK